MKTERPPPNYLDNYFRRDINTTRGLNPDRCETFSKPVRWDDDIYFQLKYYVIATRGRFRSIAKFRFLTPFYGNRICLFTNRHWSNRHIVDRYAPNKGRYRK